MLLKKMQESRMNSYESATDTFQSLSDANRLRILLLLRQRPVCVCEFDQILDISLSTISTHLKLLRASGMIKSRKEGRWVIYELAGNEALETILQNLEKTLASDAGYQSDIEKLSSIYRNGCAAQSDR
jgi:ArsR family transcriptional regulator